MHDYEFRRMIMNDHIESLHRAATRPRLRRRPGSKPPTSSCGSASRKTTSRSTSSASCRNSPCRLGRLVVAIVDGRLVAALPVAGGPALRDPFVRTAHLLRLLELRAEQLRRAGPASRGRHVCSTGMHRTTPSRQ